MCTMPEKYRNFRNSVPWLLLILEVGFVILFYFLSPDEKNISMPEFSYPAFQDVNHMVVFGFGFFLMFLRRYGFSSTAFNLLIIAFGVQCSMLIENLLIFLHLRQNELGLRRITKATVRMTAVVISTGAVLGKTNPIQLILMTIVELIFFQINQWLSNALLKIPDDVSMMHVHLFGAYFGLAVSFHFSKLSQDNDKNRSTPKSYLLSMLGTLFLWVFWPSFNSVLAMNNTNKVIYNTYFALAVSAVTAFILSVLTTKDGKFRMTHIHSAVLAGGVAIGYSARSINYPWIAMVLGLLASMIAILGSSCLQTCLHPALKIHDTSGVHFTFGLPAVLGALAEVILIVINNWTELARLGYLVMTYVGTFCLTISTAWVTGFLTGFIIKLKPFKTTPAPKCFDDQFFWECPHLAVGL